MRQLRHRGLAQHQADVRIRDQEAIAVDDVGLAFFADLDSRHDVPDELEIHFCDSDRALVARADRDGHVRLGLLAEVHRAEPGLSALGVAKRRFVRAILAGADVIHAEAGDRDLFVALRIELRDVGHFGRLTQQLEELDAAQLDVVRIELRQRGICELLLDLVNVLLDSRRGADGFLVLEIGERGLWFPGR